LSTRRRELERLNLRGASWQTPPAHRAEGEAMLEAARRTQLEGVIAKRVDSPYLPGVRSDLWRKVKLLNRQEFVIGGWLPMQGTDDVGSLLVGYYGDQGAALRYAGKVGTGFDAAERARLKRLFEQRRRRSSPFAGVVRGAGVRGARFVEPDLVAEVEFYEWTHDNRLRQPSYKGLRADKRALDVRREPAAALMDSPMRKR